jgi:hypothetical protein
MSWLRDAHDNIQKGEKFVKKKMGVRVWGKGCWVLTRVRVRRGSQ